MDLDALKELFKLVNDCPFFLEYLWFYTCLGWTSMVGIISALGRFHIFYVHRRIYLDGRLWRERYRCCRLSSYPVNLRMRRGNLCRTNWSWRGKHTLSVMSPRNEITFRHLVETMDNLELPINISYVLIKK